ncbi:MAG: FixH family protein [Proteobacteria bacterium]|nr:FixH family protein [Pseudomonadota bacterium]
MYIYVRKSLTVIFLFIVGMSIAYGRDYTVRRKIDGYTVDVSINRNPPIVGRNDLRVEIKDLLGKYVLNMPVTVNYYMPPMPGMPPMNYTVQASSRGSGYGATMDLIMTGPWNIVIRANTEGKPLRMTIPIDVR